MSTSARNRLRKSSRSRNDNHPYGYQASHFSFTSMEKAGLHVERYQAPKKSIMSKTKSLVSKIIGG